MEKTPNNAIQLPSGSSYFKKTWDTYISGIKKFVGISLIPFIFSLPILIITVSISEKNLLSWAAFLAVWSIIFYIIFLWGQLAIIQALIYPQKNKKIWLAFKNCLRILPSYAWIHILMSFLIAGAYFLFIIPGFIFLIWFNFSIFLLFTKKIKGFLALLISKEIVKGYFYQILSRMLFIVFIFWMIQVFISLVTKGLIFDLSIIMPKDSYSLKIIEAIASQFLLTIISPIWLIYNYYIFSTLSTVKKDEDIMFLKKDAFKLLFISISGWILAFLITAILLFSFIKYQNFFLKGTSNIDLLTIQTHLSRYNDDNMRYPENLKKLEPQYIKELPATFEKEENYKYDVSADGKNYELCLKKPEEECVTKNSYNLKNLLKKFR